MSAEVGGCVACPGGLNRELKALQFIFQELPLWDVATVCEPTQDPPLIEVHLNSPQPDSMMTTIQDPLTISISTPSPATPVKPVCDIATAINQHLQGGLEWLQQASPTSSTPVSQHSTLRREPPSVTLWALPHSRVTKDPLEPNEEEPMDLTKMASPTQASQWMVTPEDTPSIAHISHSPSLPIVPKTLEVAGISPIP